jgi:hypothetical protein
MGLARRLPPAALLMLLTIMSCPSGALGQLDQPDAAQTYQSIWDSVDPALWEAANELRSTSTTWHPDRAESKVLVGNLPVVERLIDATRLTPTPPPEDADAGWEGPTADMRNYRRTSYVFWADACRLIAEGDPDAAAGRVAALMRLAGQLAAEPRIAATTTAASCLQLAQELVELVCTSPGLTEAGRQGLTQSVVALDPADPAGFKTGLSGAWRLSEWIAREFKGSDAGEKLVQSLPIPEDRKRPLAEGEQEDRGRRWGGGRRGERGLWPSRELVAELREMDQQEIEEAVKDFQAMFDAAMAAWSQDDAADQLERIDQSAMRNGFGPLARLAPQFFSRQKRNADRVDDCVGKMRLSLISR